MNRYEAKQEARRARLEARADRPGSEGQTRVRRGDDALRAIPFGQPNPGRPSLREARPELPQPGGRQHPRRDVERRADAVGTGGISSDDPDAVAKLRDQLPKLEAVRAGNMQTTARVHGD